MVWDYIGEDEKRLMMRVWAIEESRKRLAREGQDVPEEIEGKELPYSSPPSDSEEDET